MPKIIALLNDEAEVVRWAAADALAQLSQHSNYFIFYFCTADVDCSRVSSVHRECHS